MTHGSLFSGIGGFDLAAEWAGFENLFHCEWNPFCRQVLKHHFPNSESYEDITKTDFTKWRGKIDVLTGGFPCQPFSVAGSRKGAEDNRYLWPQMLRAIEEIRPTWVIGENVTGIITMVLPGEEVEMESYTDITGESYKEIEERQLYVVERICQDFERVGYSVQPIIIPACAVGAPHRRDRIWFVARRIAPDPADTGPESLQYGREDRVHAAGVTSHPVLRGCDGRSEETIGGREALYTREGIFSEAERHGSGRIITDTDSDELQGQCFSRKDEAKRWKDENGRFEEYSGDNGATLPTDRWNDFPNQFPVCNRDDGISLRLVGISFSKWRQESIKALGNAIVPQVAYEIFKAIKTIHDKEK